MSAAMEEETVDWGDVETATGEGKIDVSAAGGGDDVISLGGAEDLEEEESPAVAIPALNEKEKDEKPAAKVVEEKATAAPSKPLPAGWKLQEARSGGAYYFNTVTGKTTWDFPTEDAAKSVEEKVEVAEATPAPEKLAGIQIRGAARGNGSATIGKDEAISSNKKREAETPAKQEVEAVDNPQLKRRRSNTPEERKKESWSASPEFAPKEARPAREPADRPAAREVKSNTGSWGRRPDISNESNSFNGLPSNRPRPYDNNSRESGFDSRRRPEEQSGRDRNNKQYGSAPDSSVRNNQTDRSRPAYDDRRPSEREDRDRNQGRPRETSPAPRRREEYNRGTERNQGRVDSIPPARSRDIGGDRGREGERDRYREPGADQSRNRPPRDSRVDRRDEPSGNARPVASSDRNLGYRQDYSNQRYNNNTDRANGPQRTPYPAADGGSRNGYNASRGPQDYQPRGGYPSGPMSPVTPYPPGGVQGYGQGYGQQRGGPQGGNRPLKPWIAPEEKQKRWWNKNSGEKKPVDPEAFAESEGRSSSTPSRRSPSRVSVEPTVRKTDRERELADREAAIARKERELGLK